MTGERKTRSDSKTQIGSRRALASILGPLLLSGCVSARQVQKVRDDAAIYGERQRARAVREHCMDSGAMPGTAAYLECQLKSK